MQVQVTQDAQALLHAGESSAKADGTSGVTNGSLSVRIMERDGSIRVPEKTDLTAISNSKASKPMGSNRDSRSKSQKRRLVQRIVAGVAISLIAMCFVLVAVMLHLARHIEDPGKLSQWISEVQ